MKPISKQRKRNMLIFLVVLWTLFLVYFIFQNVYTYPLKTHSDSMNAKESAYQQIDQIPNHIREAIVFIEDKRFFKHKWVDLAAMVRAAYQTIAKNNTQWASTIDQQLIKLQDEAFSRTIWRKIYEIWMAHNLSFHYTKEDILLQYVNTVPFSNNIRWRKSACNIYFHKDCALLSDSEFSYLFAIGQLGVNPYTTKNQERIYTRALRICSLLKDTQLLQKEDGCNLLEQAIEKNTQTPDQQQRPIQIYPYQAPIDPKIQIFLESLPTAQQQSFSYEQYERIEDILKTTQAHREEYDAQYCCIVAIDKNGGLISMNTCSDWNDYTTQWRINSCITPRQVWSAMKPFLYAYTFKQENLTPTDTIVDEPISFDLWDWDTYSPKNFSLKYHWEVSLAYALGNSLNVPAIKMMNIAGVKPFLEFLKEQLEAFAPWENKNTKTAENVWLSLALGTYEISPYAFTQLWRFFIPNETPIAYEKQAKDIASILEDPKNRAAEFGQDSFLNLPWWATKTWTSRKFIDAWVCGVNTQKGITLCLWMGNVNNQSMKWPSSEIGSYIWNIIAKGM